jgi:transcriptional regulator with XRE-family HTH domain
MAVTDTSNLAPHLLKQSVTLGQRLARLRIARNVKQSDAALRAGISRNTVYRLEHGDPALTLGLILRYLDAIAPGMPLEAMYAEKDPALRALAARERRQRVRDLSAAERDELEF